MTGAWRNWSVASAGGVVDVRPVDPPPSAPACDAAMLRVADAPGLAAAMQPPFGACVEAGEPDLMRAELRFSGDGRHLFYLSLSSVAAYRLDPAHPLIGRLAAQLDCSQAAAADIETALHECIMNAVVHGNLEVTGKSLADMTSMTSLNDTIEARLARPELSGRRVRVVVDCDRNGLALTVHDEGRGYDVTAAREARDDSASGRGLSLMRLLASELEIGNGGRWHRLRFRR